MGKRKNKEKDEEYLQRKIQKLEEKLKNLKETSPPLQTPATAEDGSVDLNKDDDIIPEDFLEALGPEGEEVTEVGDVIRSELANRWTKIMTDGLGKEAKDLIIKKYPTPSNFTRGIAPVMNPEIKAAVSDITMKRDKRIADRQNISGKILNCLGKSLTSLLKGEFNNKKLIEEINDGAKLVAEIFYQDSTSRRFFAVSGTTSHIKEVIKETKVDKFLFGEDCTEKIKTAQSIKKTSQTIRTATTDKVQKPPVTQNQGNRRGPPQNRPGNQSRGRGGHRPVAREQTQSSQRNKEQRYNYKEHRSPTETSSLDTQRESPTSSATYPGCRDIIRIAYTKRGTPESAMSAILNSLSANSIKQYNSALKPWWNFCQRLKIDPYEASLPIILQFLGESFHKGASYGTLNSIRSALSLIIGPRVGTDERMKRFMKGVLRSKPPAPKYNVTWDPAVVLNYLALQPTMSISLELLSRKLVTILALVTGHRVQTLSLINLKNVTFKSDMVQIFITELIKTSTKNKTQPLLHLKKYNNNIEICPVSILHHYIHVTEPLRNNTQRLILTFRKPHHPATTQTISRWIKTTLGEAGIDVNMFSAHSTRHASTSAAHRAGITIDQIQKTAGWSENSSMFAKHYNRPIYENMSFSKVICDTTLSD